MTSSLNNLLMNDVFYGPYRFQGISVAGIQTSICMPQFKLAFDVALGQDPLPQMKYFCITHGHLDHSSGIPYLISQKKMRGHPTPTFLIPPALDHPLRQVLYWWSQIENYEFEYELKPLTPDETFVISTKHFIKPFVTYHRIPSQGYVLFEKKHKLKPEFQTRSQEELKSLKQQGHELSHEIDIPEVAFTGDTQIEFVHGPPYVRESRILFIETTFLDAKKPVAEARRWGHTHLQELIEVLPLLKNQKIVLIHPSARYGPEETLSLLRKALPSHEHERVVIYPRS